MRSPMNHRLPERFFIAGLLILSAGLLWIWPPLCLVVVGLVFMLLGLWGAR